MDYADYQHLAFERRSNGVVLVTINRPEVLNATNDRLHWELTQIWLTLDADASTRVAVVTGAGRAFSAHARREAGDPAVPNGHVGRPRLDAHSRPRALASQGGPAPIERHPGSDDEPVAPVELNVMLLPDD